MTLRQVAEKCLINYESSFDKGRAKLNALNYINSLTDTNDRPLDIETKLVIINEIRNILNNQYLFESNNLRLIIEQKSITEYLELADYLENSLEGL